MRRLLLGLILLLAPSLWAQGQSVNATVVNEGGTPIAGAQIWVCGYPGVANFPCSNLVTVYGDIGLTVPSMNPVTSDQLGNYSYFLPDGVYREDITGPNVQPHTRTLTLGGFGCSSIVAGTNVTLNCSTINNQNVVTINSSGASGGCSVAGLVHTWVLLINPDATCYGSANFTWNDVGSTQNLQAGLSNTQGTSLNFLFGQSLVATGSSLSLVAGQSNTINCSLCEALGDNDTITQVGSQQPSEIYIYGQSNTVQDNQTASDIHVVGSSNNYDMDTNAGATILSVWNLGELAQVTSHNGGSVNVASIIGKSDSLLATSATSAITFASVVGQSNTVEGAADWTHLAIVGDLNIFNWANGSATNSADFAFGYGNLLQDTSGSNSVSNTIAAGIGNSVSGTTNHAGLFGYNETITGCTHCYLFGENGSIATNSFVGVGLSATPELAITTGLLTFNGTLATGTNCKANGTAANPSVAACGASIAGMFSCSTSASTGTCQVNSTAVTSNSEILITQDQADGGASQLNVTCNTTNVLNTSKPLLVSKSNGASFTINLGTVSTNPACFEYQIIN